MMLLSQIEIVLIIAANAITNYPGMLMYERILVTTFWPWFFPCIILVINFMVGFIAF